MDVSTSGTRSSAQAGGDPVDPSAALAAHHGQTRHAIGSELARPARLRVAERRRTIRSPRRRPTNPHTPASNPAEAAATRAAQAAAISAVAQHGSDAATAPHAVARAWRMRAVHAPVNNHRCGLCLCAWPCPPRAWAENTLREAQLDAAG
jgi:hypothetical protein